jgi:hypothetical protein
MKALAIILVVFGLAGFCSAPSVFAVGEIFKVEATGTEYCSDGYAKFNASNNLDLWIQMVSENEILVSTGQNFEPTERFTIHVTSYSMNSKQASYIGGAYVDDYTYIGMQGISKINKYGEITSSKGTFMWSNWFDDDCFASGKFKTVKRLQ